MHWLPSTLLGRIGKVLRQECKDIPDEPLPERWIDLINYLNAQEEERRQAEAARSQRLPLAH